ncbi:Signal transduction histidine-protein kinase BarA [compost metagenome]
MELEEYPFSLRSGIQEAFTLFSVAAKHKGLSLKYEIEEDIPDMLYGDMDRIRQVLINLISNAIKFTAQGSIDLKLFGEHMPEGVYQLKFIVRDTGIGIEEDKLDQLFHPFSQLDSSMSRKYGGTGLGLAICRTLVELMNGDIWVERNQDSGATFIFTIQVNVTDETSLNTSLYQMEHR